ncbi:hypothetical protein EE612_011351, partial [Oryza sativa]
ETLGFRGGHRRIGARGEPEAARERASGKAGGRAGGGDGGSAGSGGGNPSLSSGRREGGRGEGVGTEKRVETYKIYIFKVLRRQLAAWCIFHRDDH